MIAGVLTAVVVVAVLVAVLARSTERREGSNTRVVVSGLDLPVSEGHGRCLRADVPADTRLLRFYASARRGGGRLQATVSDHGRELAAGASRPVNSETVVTLALDRRIRAEVLAARVCIAARGPGTVRLAGNKTGPFGPGNPSRSRNMGDVPRVDLLASGRTSYASLAPDVGRRFSLLKVSWLGPWALWVLAALVAATFALAYRVLARS